ncbi:MAG: hypothetical protein IJX94_01485 [Clostridia bacterium]|nr:hypothetical protein [Clostridia bacterium]
MKRLFFLFTIALLLVSLCSCGGKPENTSDAMYQIGLNALSVADEYINGKITADEAHSRLKDIEELADAQYERWCEEFGTETLVGTKYENDSGIYFEIAILELKIMGAKHSFDTTPLSEIIEARDDLEEQLGK